MNSPTVCTGALSKPITWSASDTPATVVQIKQHNAAWQAECGG